MSRSSISWSSAFEQKLTKRPLKGYISESAAPIMKKSPSPATTEPDGIENRGASPR